MANADKTLGFELVSDEGGTTSPIEFAVDSSNGNIIGLNDPVTLEADGNVTRSAANDGIVVIGVVQGILDSNRKSIKRLAASTAGTVLVTLAKDNLYRIQSVSGTTVNATEIGATFNHVVTSDADSGTGISGVELDTSSTAGQCRVLGKDSGSAFGEDHVKLIVSFNEYVGASGTTTI